MPSTSPAHSVCVCVCVFVCVHAHHMCLSSVCVNAHQSVIVPRLPPLIIQSLFTYIYINADCPWCEIRSTHASYQHVKTHFEAKKKERWEPGCSVKSRNEPRNILYVCCCVC